MKSNKVSRIFTVFFFYGVSALCSACLCADTGEDLVQVTESPQANGVMRSVTEEEVRQYPHSSVLSLEVEYRTRSSITTIRGTGFAITPNLVVTAAHAIYHPKYRFPTKIMCYQGRHGSQAGQEVEVARCIVKNSYINTYDPQVQSNFLQQMNALTASPKAKEDIIFYLQATYDYALLYLENPLQITDFLVIPPIKQEAFSLSCKFCGYPWTDYDVVCNLGRNHENASYPYEVDARFQRKIGGYHLLTYQTRSYKGMSGSPVRYAEPDDSRWFVNSVLSRSYDDNDTICCELTESRVAFLEDMKRKLNNETELKEAYLHIIKALD